MMSAQYSSAGAPLQSRASRPASALRTVAQPLQVATNTLGTRKRTKDMASIFDKRSASNNREATRSTHFYGTGAASGTARRIKRRTTSDTVRA